MKLISVSGIGPKGGLAILRGVNIPEFVSAVEREDDKFLTGFPGVGKKTARQIILDLKGKLSSTFTQNVESNDRDGVEQDTIQIVEEAKEALKALGYTDKELRPIIPTLHKVNHNSTDELVRKALGLLMKK